MTEIFFLSIATASISFSVSETKLFNKIREWIKGKNSFAGDLVSCGYCFGHWVAMVFVILFRPRLFNYWWFADHLLTLFVIAWLSGLQWAVMCLIMERTGK